MTTGRALRVSPDAGGIGAGRPLAEPLTREVDAPHTLRDYVFLADGWRGAMLNPDGEITWLCFPRWSGPALMAGLLGARGRYLLAPPARHVRGGYYEDGSLIWRQRWITHDRVIEVREAMAYPATPGRAVVLRRISAVEMDASMYVELVLGSDYGRKPSKRWRREGDTWTTESGQVHARWSGAPGARSIEAGAGLACELAVEGGHHLDLVLELDTSSLAGRAPPDPADLWQRTESAWAEAVPACADLPARRDVRRAFAVLRGLTNGDRATVAAATTALPERAEAGRNYDYRYAWVRDICYIGRAGSTVEGAGHVLDDAVHFVTERLLADGPRMKPAYRDDGGRIPTPEHLGVPGYPGGSDQVGNRAVSQFQLDAFGEALLLLAAAARGGTLETDGWRAAELAVSAIAERWKEKDSGIWEVGPDHWTHSRLICAAGLRAMAGSDGRLRWRNDAIGLADQLLAEADRTSLHPSGRWQRSPTDTRVDASLLLAEIRGALADDDPRSVSTRQAILAELCQDDYLYRFADPGKPLGEQEGAFLVCNFWMALAKLRSGDHQGGSQWFERTRSSCGGSGLFSEEFDVAQRQLRGNLPQAFVHALLIEVAAEMSSLGRPGPRP